MTDAPPDLEHVPTLPELAVKGLAFETQRTFVDGAGRVRTELRYEVTAAGQQLLNDAMHRNAVRWKEADR